MNQDLKWLFESCRENDKNNFQKNLEINNSSQYEFLYWVTNIINKSVANSKSYIYIGYYWDFNRYFILGVIDLLRNHINSAATNFRHSQESWIIFIYLESNHEELSTLCDWWKFATKNWKKISDCAYKYIKKRSSIDPTLKKFNSELSFYKNFVNEHLTHGSSKIKEMNKHIESTKKEIEMTYFDSPQVIDDIYERFAHISWRMWLNILEFISKTLEKEYLDKDFDKNMKILRTKEISSKNSIL